jgi:hypothetical protein
MNQNDTNHLPHPASAIVAAPAPITLADSYIIKIYLLCVNFTKIVFILTYMKRMIPQTCDTVDQLFSGK